MEKAIKTIQNLQGTKQHLAIQLVNKAIHQKYDSTEVFIVAFFALLEARGIRIALDALVEEELASNKAIPEKVKEDEK